MQTRILGRKFKGRETVCQAPVVGGKMRMGERALVRSGAQSLGNKCGC